MDFLNDNDFQAYVKELDETNNIIGASETRDIPEFINPNDFLDGIKDDFQDKLLELLERYNILYTEYLKSETERQEIIEKCDDLQLKYENLLKGIGNPPPNKPRTSVVYPNDNHYPQKITLSWLIENMPHHIHLIKCGDFYKARYGSACVLNNLLGYKLYWEVPFNAQWKRTATGFRSYQLDYVLGVLRRHDLNCVVVNNYKIVYQCDNGKDINDPFTTIEI